MRTLTKAGLLVGVALALAAPRPAAAQNGIWINSSMNASCLDTACTQLAFVLNVGPANPSLYVTWFSIKAGDTNWRFGDVLEVRDGDGNLLSTEVDITPDEIYIQSFGNGFDPLTVIVAMSSTDGLRTLQELTYSGIAHEDEWMNPPTYEFGGNVAPEPFTIILLGSGLAGVAGVASRRRRKKGADDLPA